MTVDAGAPGFRGLFARGLIRMHSDMGNVGADKTVEKAVGWGRPGAASALARRSCLPLDKRGGRVTMMLTQAAYIADGSRTTPLTATETALVLSHGYQFTGVHALTITAPTRAAVSRTSCNAGAKGAWFTVIEHRHDQPDEVRRIRHAWPEHLRLRRAAATSETDRRRVLLPDDVEAMVLHTFFAGLDSMQVPSERHTVRFNLDRLDGERLDGDADESDLDRHRWHPGAPAWMPALLGDILAHLNIRASDLRTPQDFTDWAHAHLRYSVHCENFTHLRQVNPSDGTVYTPAEVEAAQTAEDMLAALRMPAGETVGCADDAAFLSTALDMDILSRVSDETLLRWIVRAVQYLDAGLDLAAAADFWFFAVTPADAARLMEWRCEEETVVTNLLFSWCGDLLSKGTFNPSANRYPARPPFAF